MHEFTKRVRADPCHNKPIAQPPEPGPGLTAPRHGQHSLAQRLGIDADIVAERRSQRNLKRADPAHSEAHTSRHEQQRPRGQTATEI